VFKVADYAWPDMPMSFHLHKELPVASGIGGGSADAAACYRAISMLRRIVDADDGPLMMTEQRVAGLAEIGADIPMCVHSEAARVTGIGEEITRLEDMPAMPILLVNPGVSVSTPAVFKALEKRQNPAMGEIPRIPDAGSFVEWLSVQRNDLQDAAQSVFPQIKSVLQALRRVQGCALARMSGSGATCFGLFSDKEALQAAVKRVKADHPDWWVRASVINGAVSSAPYRIRSTT
jgi:4-diphosphocytidyl-2-C-methyl-D-erythritol kinase